MDNNRYERTNIVANIIKILMPFIAISAMVLYEYVSVGASFNFNTQDITRMVLVAVCMLFVYLPLKDIFLNAISNGKRTTGKLDDYGLCVDYVYKSNIEKLKKYCIYEYEKRRREVVDSILRNTSLTFDTFKAKYAFDKIAIKKDKNITKKERKAFLQVINQEKKIKPETIDTLLPGGMHKGDHRRVKSNSKRKNAFITTRKSLTCIISGTLLVSITFGFTDTASSVAIATRAILIIGLVAMYAFSAFVSATAINNEYCNELSEKTTFLTEFKEQNQ